jgi:general stress protein 26
MEHSELDKFHEIFEAFDTAMLVTKRGEELRSRPMAIADRAEDGRTWFLTSVDSGKLDELTEFPFVNVVMQAEARFLSISGTAIASREPGKLDELWSAIDNVWFEKGRDDPSLIFIEVVPTYAEYWDRSGLNAIRFLFELGISGVTGDRPELGDEAHRKIDFPESAKAGES